MSVISRRGYPRSDVLIIGGGVAGSATALALLARGARVTVIERSDYVEPRIGESIPPDANLLLEQLGVRSAFLEQGHLPCFGSHSLWGSDQLGHNDFMTSPHGTGWHLNRARFDAMLSNQAQARGAQHIAAECQSVETEAGKVVRVITSKGAFTAPYYVDATGRNGLLSRALGVKRKIYDRQITLWSRFRVPPGSLGNATWLEAMPYGWWYAAAVPDGEAVVALASAPREAKARQFNHLPHWAMALSGSNLIASKLNNARLIPASFRKVASHSYCTDRATGPNWLLVGDAATAFDPLSSAGIYNALIAGQLAARALTEPSFEAGCAAYQARLAEDYASYLRARAELYSQETRWSNAPFWLAARVANRQDTQATTATNQSRSDWAINYSRILSNFGRLCPTIAITGAL